MKVLNVESWYLNEILNDGILWDDGVDLLFGIEYISILSKASPLYQHPPSIGFEITLYPLPLHLEYVATNWSGNHFFTQQGQKSIAGRQARLL